MQRRKIQHDNEVSEFIWRVKQRPALYNYKLAPKYRRRADVAKCWQEVADEIGRVTAEDCRKKWKNLRDTYHQYRLRKSKFKGCLEKWQYSKDLEFLADIYQPKLKSERMKYSSEYAKSNAMLYNMNESKISTIASMIDIDDETTNTSYGQMNEDTLENHYDDDNNSDHVVNINEVQFCDVDTKFEVNNRTPEAYGDVFLYEEGDTNILTVDVPEQDHKKFNMNKNHLVESGNSSRAKSSENMNQTISNNKDELDLFFQFLKTKIQRLPTVDITAIQIEFLNAVLRKETTHAANS